MTTSPFTGEERVVIVLPSLAPTLEGRLPLLELERAEFEAELAAPVAFASTDPGFGPRWLLELDPAYDGSPTTSWQPDESRIVSRAKDVDGIFETLNLLRTARRTGGVAAATDADTIDEAVERVVDEVADTYPSFELRGLDWPEICSRHAECVRRSTAPLPDFQAWLAELQDSHTWVSPGHGNLPYGLEVTSDAIGFVRVPTTSLGHEAGVRPGWRLVGIDDEAPDAPGWLRRTASPPHSRPYLAGRRLLAGPDGSPRELTAADPAGHVACWEEAPSLRPPEPVVSWQSLAGDTGYLRIGAWLSGDDDTIGSALADLRGSEKLVLDLRHNPGGNLVLAARTRARFLRRGTTLGSIRYSVGGGALSAPVPLESEPPDKSERWLGRLVVLTDELTFSSSEDFLLGLQGLEHVTVVGRPTGGGSGRPRSIRLLPGWTLTVSTALTYDRSGRCIEGAGVPVDVELPRTAGEDQVLRAAESI